MKFVKNIDMKTRITILILSFSLAVISQNLPGYLPSNGLVLWMPFTGNSNDLSGNNNNGTVNGAVLTNDRFNSSNSAYNFNGSGNYILVNNCINMDNNYLTASLWFKSTSTQFQQLLYKVNFGNSQKEEYSICTNFGQSGVINASIKNGNNCNVGGAGWMMNNVNAIYTDGNWHHLVFTYNGTNSRVYIDGAQISNTVFPTSVIDNCPGGKFIIGVNYAGGIGFNGQIDDIGIWNRALTQQEITSLYQGCTGSVTASITPQGNTTFCAGNSVVLNATSGSGYTYQWSLNGNVINGATLSTISATQQGNYMVNIVAGGCTYPSNSINVNVNALPNVSINGLPNFINYFASPVQVIALPNGGISSGLGYSNGVFTPSIAGLGFKKIQYQYTDNNGCTGSASLSTIVYDTLCANPLGFIKSASNKIDLFPNPVQETITIKGNVPPHSSLEIFDTNGNLVFQELLSSENEQISIRQLKRALYHYRIINAGKILKSASIIKE